MRNPRFLPVLVAAVLVGALAGGLFGSNALARQDRAAEKYELFQAALSAIDANYVEKLPPDRLVYSAIDGMLKTLDPHSSFMDPRTYAQLRERQEGRYYGLGISILVVDGDITVMSLFEGSPAYKKGIRRGDVIARIEGQDTKGWTSDQAVRKLRGPKGTAVNISLKRSGYDGLIDMNVERDEINIPTVRTAFMMDRETGYVRMQDFSETTDDEFGRALASLSSQGMKRLVLDLRDNPGGPLDQAIRVANRFLPRGQKIVYTRGRAQNSDVDYFATEPSDYTDLPVVVLVNRNTASASEIVSGALQDHDRALIVGETTFGKALVQSVYRISMNAGLALTTGRYYTPSGRMIQRPWDNAFDEYLTYTLRDQPTGQRSHEAADLRYTDTGRKVYSGGGIEPDQHIAGPVEGFNPTRFGRSLYAKQMFENFAERFTAEGDTRIVANGNAKNRRTVRRGFAVTDEMVVEFKQFLKDEGEKVDESAFAKDHEFIRAMIKLQVDMALFGIEEARRSLVAQDPQAQAALGLFPEAERLTAVARARAMAK
ncbi:MAG TPA: S41 family peptidase [Vicinamibacterales bacterium]|nr:S41 family peptidase [Vicinamibacterales bacterium]